MDVACVNAFIIYNMMHQSDLTLLDYVSTHLIGWYTSQSRAPPEQNVWSKRKHQYHFEPNNLPLHLPVFEYWILNFDHCEYCYKEGFARKTFVKWASVVHFCAL